MAYNANDVANLGHLASLASSVKTGLVPADKSIAIANNSIKAAISNDNDNLLILANNGLKVNSTVNKPVIFNESVTFNSFCVIGSTPSTVDGAIWLEDDDT